mgnify:FL=1
MAKCGFFIKKQNLIFRVFRSLTDESGDGSNLEKSMICFILTNQNLVKNLKKDLQGLGGGFVFFAKKDGSILDQLYAKIIGIQALVCEPTLPGLPDNAWLDLLEALGRRVPVIICSDKSQHIDFEDRSRSEMVSWLKSPLAADILEILDLSGVLGLSKRLINRNKIPVYNPMLSLHMLRQVGALSIITIHASDFRRVAIEYGADVYNKLKICFQQLLVEIWGSKGSFRGRDILCQLSPSSNTYVIILEESRTSDSFRAPGSLEKLSDRILVKLQHLLWAELFTTSYQRILPNYLMLIPKFSVGYATALYNPCVDAAETIENLFESAKSAAKVQSQRTYDRQREFIQALIQTRNLLVPHYQAVFYAPGITEQEVLACAQEGSMKHLVKHIFGFESLIRVNIKMVDQLLAQEGPIYLEAKYLRPDIIFAMASSVKLTLELDQACLRLAANNFGDLPGQLMANILPRNFYYIEQLQHLIPQGTRITFEVSESEAINNFGLLLQAREKLARKNYSIAIDDFGKGYAGMDRIIKIKPDIVKLDRSLIQDIQNDDPKKAFVSGLVNAAKITNSVILAEGVENIEEMKVLQQIGVDLIQGFLFHRPASIEDIKKDLADAELSNIDDIYQAS